jgi:hypothetical protein
LLEKRCLLSIIGSGGFFVPANGCSNDDETVQLNKTSKENDEKRHFDFGIQRSETVDSAALRS